MSRGIPILLYHRVGNRDGSYMDKYTVSPRRFAEQMEWLHRNGWQPITLESVLDNTEKPNRSVVLTFDDGFVSNRVHAWPILNRYSFPAATFVVTDCLGSCNRWDPKPRASHALLSAGDLDIADAGLMRFHSHGATHADLRYLDDVDSLRCELNHSRLNLAPVRTAGEFFSYPWGGWNWDVVREVAKAGYAGAVTCVEGLNSPDTNPYLLRRVEIHECDLGWRLWLKVHLGRDLLKWRHVRPPKLSRLRARIRRYRQTRTEAA
jgi:peptidoglycan/xylan/chitin deacetylase (PgdA/CDA1 family)